MLVCTFVVRTPPKTGFLAHRMYVCMYVCIRADILAMHGVTIGVCVIWAMYKIK